VADKTAKQDESSRSIDGDRILALLERVLEKGAESGLNAQQLEAILSKVGVTNAIAMQQALKPENTQHDHISAFFTKADQAKYGHYTNKPKLVCADGTPREVFMNFHRESEDDLTCAEIDAYNSITTDCEARNGTWKAQITDKGKRLHISVPVAFMDARMSLPPSLILLVHELKTGQGVAEIHELLSEIARLKALVGETETPGAKRPPTTTFTTHGSTVRELEEQLESQPFTP
jgi:hypothetical protein